MKHLDKEQAGNGRDSKGRFAKGNKGGGRKRMPAAFKQLATEYSFVGLQKVAEIIDSPESTARDLIPAVRLMLEYAIGKPAGELDRERLDLEWERFKVERQEEDGDNTIHIVMSKELEELAR